MSFLKKLWGDGKNAAYSTPAWAPPAGMATERRSPTEIVYEGSEPLEVVGESYRQDDLWKLVGGRRRTDDRIRHAAVAVLVTEPDNGFDANAVAVWIDGCHVGYLARDVAARYRPGLERLSAVGPVGVRAMICGGGHDGPARLGVFLEHNPADFGLPANRRAVEGGGMRTGESGSAPTWVTDLPQDTRAAIAELRELLARMQRPLDRHYLFAELEERLYRLRDVEQDALSDYDAACLRHDAEMEVIRPALLAAFGVVPLLLTYRQQCIRQQKAKAFHRALWWAERGLALYSTDAHSRDSTDDLQKRAVQYRTKLAQPAPTPANGTTVSAAPLAATTAGLICARCGTPWTRERTKGRKPALCPTCTKTQ